MAISLRMLGVGLAGLAVAGSGAAASAKTVTYKNVVSPSKLISCYQVRDSARIDCMAPYLPRPGQGEGDPYFTVATRGKAKLAARGDYPGFISPRRTLHYGDTWLRSGVRCTMRTTGMTCRNRDKHGFHIARGKTYRF